MAIKDILPSANLTLTDMADTFGVASNELGTITKSAPNMFSLRKPQSCPGIFLDNPTGIDDDHSLVCPLWVDTNNTMPGEWSYRRPKGGESSPFRGGDSAGYYRLARPFVTSGKIAGINYQWSLRQSQSETSGRNLTLTFTRPTHAANLRENHVKQHGEFLSKWYWSVLLKGPSGKSYLYVAGELQNDGITAYSRLGEGGGNSIIAPFTADMCDELNGGMAIFFLWLPGRSIQGMSNADLQGLLGSGKMIGVYSGRDLATGDVWINPVPLKVTRSSGNVIMDPTTVNVAYDAFNVTVWGYAAYPVKIAITGGDSSVIWGDQMDWDAVYIPDVIYGNFSVNIPIIENPYMNPKSVTLTAYKATYNPAAIGSIPAIDKATMSIVQAAAPMQITFNPEVLIIEWARPTGNVFIDCPKDGQWYVRAITETPDLPVSGGNYALWVLKLLKLSSQDGVVDTPAEIPINPDTGYMTGPAYVQVICDTNYSGADRTAYIHLSHRDGYSTLKVIQQFR